MAALDKWVSDAGPELPVGDVAYRALDVRLRAVIHYLPLAAHLADEDLEYVHSARVSTRRANTALVLFADFVPRKPRRKTKRALKQIRSSMGEARDLDVYLARFGTATAAGAERLLRRLGRQRQAAQMEVIECTTPWLAKQRLRRRVAKLLKKVASGQHAPAADQTFGDWAGGELRRQWDELSSAVPDSNPTADQLHAFRIAIKRFRYAIELLSSGLPSTIRDVVYPQVTDLQDQLGEIQDHAVAAEKLCEWHQASDDADERNLLSQLQQQERQQYQGKVEAFGHWWRRERIDQLREQVEQVAAEAP